MRLLVLCLADVQCYHTIVAHADLHFLIRQGYIYIKCNIKILGNVRKALSPSREIHSSSINPGNVLCLKVISLSSQAAYYMIGQY